MVYISGAILGGFLAFKLDRANSIPVISLRPTRSLIGGICMLFGARLAGGCTRLFFILSDFYVKNNNIFIGSNVGAKRRKYQYETHGVTTKYIIK